MIEVWKIYAITATGEKSYFGFETLKSEASKLMRRVWDGRKELGFSDYGHTFNNSEILDQVTAEKVNIKWSEFYNQRN